MSLYVPYYRPYNKHNTNIHAPGGILTHDPSKRAAEDHALDRTATGCYLLLTFHKLMSSLRFNAGMLSKATTEFWGMSPTVLERFVAHEAKGQL